MSPATQDQCDLIWCIYSIVYLLNYSSASFSLCSFITSLSTTSHIVISLPHTGTFLGATSQTWTILGIVAVVLLVLAMIVALCMFSQHPKPKVDKNIDFIYNKNFTTARRSMKKSITR